MSWSTACVALALTGGVVTDRPATVTVVLDADARLDIRFALMPKTAATVRLTVSGVTPTDAAVGFMVFLNKPDATPATPPTDPHFVAAFAFSPTASLSPQGFVCDATPALLRLDRLGRLDLGKPLKLTLVALPPSGEDRVAAGTRVPFAAVAFSVRKP